MAIAKQKQVQTLINAVAEQALIIQEASRKLEALRAIYTEQKISVTGTKLQGKEALVLAYINKIKQIADDPVATEVISNYVESHKGKALE